MGGHGEGAHIVLLAEDSEPVRMLLGDALRHGGYDVLEAADADQALRLCGQRRGGIDLLVTDVTLPGTDGVRLAEALHALHPGARVLFLSAYPEAEVVSRWGLPAGAPFLHKPFTLTALYGKVRELLAGPG